VGHTYRIVGDVDASGVYGPVSVEPPKFIMLHPRSRRPSGPEIAFTRQLPRGQTFRIVSARIFDTPISDTIYYLLEFPDDPLRTSAPVQIRFNRDNGSLDDGRLNPSYYERVK
jgi:hypothetical protein